MTPYADMYDEWTPPCPNEEQAAEEWADWMRTKREKEEQSGISV